MDTVKLKFQYGWDAIAQEDRERYFCDEVPQRKLGKIVSTNSSRPAYTNNRWRKERQTQGIYTPKYWIEADFVNPNITYFILELSLPKLIFGTSAIELKNTDLSLTIEKIQEFSRQVGIHLFKKQILSTTPTVVSFGKNIDITTLATCSQAISILSKFNERFRSDFIIREFSEGGSEIYFNSKTSTFKVYDKLREIKNNAITQKEREIVEASLSTDGKIWICEVLRAELTLKGAGTIRKRLSLYIGKVVTLETMFDQETWHKLLEKEVGQIFNHPLADFIFLSQLHANVIEKLLDKHIRNITTKLWVRNLIEEVQRFGGTSGIRKHYAETYKSRQTYHNHMKITSRLTQNIEISKFENLSSQAFHWFFLKQFNIETKKQQSLF